MTPRPALIRPPSAAGLFYPARPQTLSADLDALLGGEEALKPAGAIVGMIVPHAGYVYSGPAAALAYKLLANNSFDCVVIVAPSHREYFDGISVYEGDAYRTPLGDIAVDAAARARLIDGDTIIEASSRGHGEEHAIEVQLPFIQRMLREARILPIAMGEQRREYSFHLGERLAGIAGGGNTLLVASSDLSHYRPRREAESLDAVIAADVASLDSEKLMDDLETERGEACGGGPMVAVISAARLLGAKRAEILCRCDSGDVTRDRDSVVGYLSAVFFSAN
jgi:AmmeMemoRadiSam system protein B